MNPLIEVDGDRAKANWYFLGPLRFARVIAPYGSRARYEDDYVKVNGEWKFSI